MQAGCYRVTITPPIGTYLAGYGSRAGPAQGVHDDLCGRCLVLDDPSGGLAIVAVDVLQLPQSFTDHVRAEIARGTGVPREQVLVCATHTHSGPDIEGRYTPGGPDRCLVELWQRALVGCAEAAWRSRQEVEPGVAFGTIQHVGVNRRHADGRPVDPAVGVLSVRARGGPYIGAFINYTCHPVVLGPDNLLISADYPGYAVRTVEAVEGAGMVAMFTNGAEGDVNTGHSADLSGIGAPIPGRTFERARRLGRRLGGAVLEALEGPALPLTGPVRGTVREVLLPLREVASVDEATAALEAADQELNRFAGAEADVAAVTAARIRRFHAEVNLSVAKQRAAESDTVCRAKLQALRVGELALVGIPGELFVELGLEVKERSPFPHTLVIGLANGSIGYLPTRAACDAGGYEAVATRFAPGSGEVVRDACLAMLQSLREASV